MRPNTQFAQDRSEFLFIERLSCILSVGVFHLVFVEQGDRLATGSSSLGAQQQHVDSGEMGVVRFIASGQTDQI